jgi:hypothetical protein
MRRYFLAIFVLIIPALTFASVSFPYGSVMNFNPSYMVYNTQWSVSYETYFGEPQQMDFVIFQPFKNGFAGKLGFYTSGSTSGIAYSVAAKSGNLNVGSDFLISDYGPSRRPPPRRSSQRRRFRPVEAGRERRGRHHDLGGERSTSSRH